jgi:hypothetical protein
MKQKEREIKTPADNEVLRERGCMPPEQLCEFASSPPAQAFVRPPQLRKAVRPLSVILGQRSAIGKREK